ncbi:MULTISPECIES: dATP/dGTP diphosphohydrolase domain-containing protein [unclassified Azospirillum]|uniref:dATP/dGTP diphosphohydrolase domain-containing protein n=1 Tax=unclassified Azospirillum TaxID=2630922 RepID=UPI000D6479CB|nr:MULTISPECIES: dATP/dGTP diphosphohydrolase domain-containing protein [unclassified Azospirillum]
MMDDQELGTLKAGPGGTVLVEHEPTELKHDAGKDPWHLLPFDAIRCAVKVLAFGRAKYGSRSWERGMEWSRVYDAALRHLTAWHEREEADPETGFSHLWHLLACVLFLTAYELRGKGTDDRPPRDELVGG